MLGPPHSLFSLAFCIVGLRDRMGMDTAQGGLKTVVGDLSPGSEFCVGMVSFSDEIKSSIASHHSPPMEKL